jgi:Trk K+ transport system NAD-binding subunit
MVPAVLRGRELFVPTGNFVFEDNDAAYILGEPSMLDRLFGPCRDALRKFSSLVILGAEARTALLLRELGLEQITHPSSRSRARDTRFLLGNPRIKVIDGDQGLLKALSATFPDIDPLNHQLNDEHFMEEEDIGSADIVLALTSNQSTNILSALLAKNAGAHRTLALVTNDLYSPILYSLDIDILINEKTVMSGTILDRIRKAKIRRLYSFPHNVYELIEIQISKSFEHLGTEIRDLNLPKGLLITFVIHEGKTTVPTGTTKIYEDDLVGLIIKKEQIGKIEAFFGA